jgi:hypothetical protein
MHFKDARALLGVPINATVPQVTNPPIFFSSESSLNFVSFFQKFEGFFWCRNCEMGFCYKLFFLVFFFFFLPLAMAGESRLQEEGARESS